MLGLATRAGAATVHMPVPHRHDWERAASAMLRLTLGEPVTGDDPNWERVFELAVRERCAPLAWHRGAAEIRKAAPLSIVARWRGVAVEAQRHGAWHLGLLADVVSRLESHGVRACVLKGPPLSLRLYGDSTVRASADLDLFIPERSRDSARQILYAAGWQVIEGSIPWTETLSLATGEQTCFLEVHSSIADLNLLHLRLPEPGVVRRTVDGHSLPVHEDSLLPAYLATHAAKHMPVALIYYVDFLALWRSLGPSDQQEALDAARRAKLSKYLAWAWRRAQAVEAAGAGNRAALRLLDIGPSGRRGFHAIFRDILLAETPFDATRAAAAWLFPPHLRSGVMPLAQRWMQRVRKPWVDYLVPGRKSSGRGAP